MDEIVYRIINFVILFGALGFACRKMIKNMFGGRREKISRELAEAEDAKERAKSLQGDMESARLKNEERRAKLMEDARLQAEMTKRETERSGELEAQSLKDNALQSEPQLRKEMQSRVAADAIRKVAQTASEVLKDGSFEASKQALNERFIQQIKDLVSAMPSDILNMNELKKQLDAKGSHQPSVSKDMMPSIYTGQRNDVCEHPRISPVVQDAVAEEISEAIYAEPLQTESQHHEARSVEPLNIDSLNLENLSRQMIEKALERNGGNRKKAAQELGISDRTLYRKIKQLKIK